MAPRSFAGNGEPFDTSSGPHRSKSEMFFFGKRFEIYEGFSLKEYFVNLATFLGDLCEIMLGDETVHV